MGMGGAPRHGTDLRLHEWCLLCHTHTRAPPQLAQLELQLQLSRLPQHLHTLYTYTYATHPGPGGFNQAPPPTAALHVATSLPLWAAS